MKVVIVAGGLATRMRPITEEIPKCLVDINGTPLIEHQLLEFKRQGFVDFIFCVAHLAHKVKEYFGDGKKWGLHIEYVEERKELMGTAGSVKLAESDIAGDFLVFYGDDLTDMDFHALLEYHKKKGGVATVVMRALPPGYKSTSIITLDANKKIKVFLEKPSEELVAQYADEEKFINSGMYVCKKDIFKYIPAGEKYDFAKQVFPLLMQEEGLFGYVTGEFFREIGRVEKYEAFLKEVEGKKSIFDIAPKGRKAVFLDRDGVLNENLPCITGIDKLKVLPGVSKAVARLNASGFLVVVVSNQPDIAKGKMTFGQVKLVHEKLVAVLAEEGGHIDRFFVCPHHPEKGFPGEIPELKMDCDCRKPKPGLLLDACRELNIDLGQSWMVGDSKTDVLAGIAAGAKTVFVSGGGSGSRNEVGLDGVSADVVVRDLVEAVNRILRV